MRTTVLLPANFIVLGVLVCGLRAQEPAAIEKTVLAHERQLWEAFKQKDGATIGKLLADDYLEVQRNQRINKAGILKAYKTYDITDYQITDVTVILLGKEAAVLSYRLTF
jgi:hypothetical protein